MKIIIAPAKKMKRDLDSFSVKGKPHFLTQTRILAKFLKSRTLQQLKELWQASDKVVAASQKQLEELDLENKLTPAIISFSGIQYQYMAPGVFDKSQYRYLADHLWILSGFYGALRPFHGIHPYRL